MKKEGGANEADEILEEVGVQQGLGLDVGQRDAIFPKLEGGKGSSTEGVNLGTGWSSGCFIVSIKQLGDLLLSDTRRDAWDSWFIGHAWSFSSGGVQQNSSGFSGSKGRAANEGIKVILWNGSKVFWAEWSMDCSLVGNKELECLDKCNGTSIHGLLASVGVNEAKLLEASWTEIQEAVCITEFCFQQSSFKW